MYITDEIEESVRTNWDDEEKILLSFHLLADHNRTHMRPEEDQRKACFIFAGLNIGIIASQSENADDFIEKIKGWKILGKWREHMQRLTEMASQV